MKMKDDTFDNVQLTFVWAYEDIATILLNYFVKNWNCFMKGDFDSNQRVKIESPEMFRVIGKRKSEYVKHYLEKLQCMQEMITFMLFV